MIKLDLHVHSKYSNDSISDPKRIIKIAKLRGLQGISITDHNTIKGSSEAKKYSDKNFNVIIGSEINTESGEVIGLFLNDEIKPGLGLIDTIEKIHEQEGLAIISHPFDKYRKYAIQCIDKRILEVIDGIEILNGRSKMVVNDNARNFTDKNNIRMITAGSDAHTLLEIGNTGLINVTHIEEEIEEDDLRTLLIKGKFETYGRPSSKYLVFGVIGRNFKKIKIQKFVDLFNIIQEIYIRK